MIREEVRKVKGQAEALRFFNYPFEAVEVALVNAIYHRSYEHQSSIEVNVRPRAIEILSFPGPLPSINNKALSHERAAIPGTWQSYYLLVKREKYLK